MFERDQVPLPGQLKSGNRSQEPRNNPRKKVNQSDSQIKNPKNPDHPKVLAADGSVIKSYDLPVGAHLLADEGSEIKAGDILVKIPRAFGKSGDITGGLPRVTELFEARNPSDPAVVAEIDGVVSFGKKLKRGNREVIITSKTGDEISSP